MERGSCSALSSGTPVAQLVFLSWSFCTGTLQPASTGTTDGTTQISVKGIVILAQLHQVIVCHVSQNFSMAFQQIKACNIPVSHPLWLPLIFLFSLCVCKNSFPFLSSFHYGKQNVQFSVSRMDSLGR